MPETGSLGFLRIHFREHKISAQHKDILRIFFSARLLAMTDNDTPSTFPRFHLPDCLKLGPQRLRLEALESLRNLRAFEYTGSTLSQGRTFVLGPTPSSDDWATAHRSTLENLLWVIIEYYRRLHGDTVLKVALLQIMELDLPELPVHPNRFTFEDTREWTGPSHTPFHLDIRALEMLSVDQLVDQIYEDRLIKQDIQGFVTRIPVFCSYYRTPLFQTTQAKYYKMVFAAFEQRPNRADIPWVTTPAIYDV
jgi:hypothetical protein